MAQKDLWSNSTLFLCDLCCSINILALATSRIFSPLLCHFPRKKKYSEKSHLISYFSLPFFNLSQQSTNYFLLFNLIWLLKRWCTIVAFGREQNVLCVKGHWISHIAMNLRMLPLQLCNVWRWLTAPLWLKPRDPRNTGSLPIKSSCSATLLPIRLIRYAVKMHKPQKDKANPTCVLQDMEKK